MKIIDNLKSKLRGKLKSFLGIYKLEDDLEKFQNDTQKDLFNHENNIKWLQTELKKANERLSKANEKIDALHTTISNVVSIGADIVTPYDSSGSWAVVCVEGKYNVVKFVNLRGQYGRDILQFLKQYESGRYVIDAPMGFFSKDMFIDWNK